MRRRSKRVRNITCSECGKSGHYKSNCPEVKRKKKKRKPRGRHCPLCGKRGHYAKSCDGGFRIIDEQSVWKDGVRKITLKMKSHITIDAERKDLGDWNTKSNIRIFNNAMRRVKTFLDKAVKYVALHHSLEDEDQIQIFISTFGMTKCIKTGFIQMSVAKEAVMEQLTHRLQSMESLRFDETTELNITTMKTPRGKGRSVKLYLEDYKASKGVKQIRNSDNLCLARAVVVALSKIRDDKKTYHAVSQDTSPVQTERAIALLNRAGIVFNDKQFFLLEHIKQIAESEGITINLVLSENVKNIFPVNDGCETHIYLLQEKNHYNVINSMTAFYGSKYFCRYCRKPHSHATHKCEHLCSYCKCKNTNCSVVENEKWKTCSDCFRNYPTKECFDNHLTTVCGVSWFCVECNRTIKRKETTPEDHIHHHFPCLNCKEITDVRSHQCYIQKTKLKPPSEKYIFFDLETTQNTGEHKANLAVAQKFKSKVFYVYRNMDDFCKWLIQVDHRHFTAIAHYGKGFDFSFILEYCSKNNIEYHPIYNGSKILYCTIGGKLGLRLVDSLNFLTTSLSKMPKMFGLEKEIMKGYFPFLFNTYKNRRYRGKLPAWKYFCTGCKSPQERKLALQWYLKTLHERRAKVKKVKLKQIHTLITKTCVKTKDTAFLKQVDIWKNIKSNSLIDITQEQLYKSLEDYLGESSVKRKCRGWFGYRLSEGLNISCENIMTELRPIIEPDSTAFMLKTDVEQYLKRYNVRIHSKLCEALDQKFGAFNEEKQGWSGFKLLDNKHFFIEPVEYDFSEQLVLYCCNDVQVLRLCCEKFRELFITKVGADPFTYITISSLNFDVYRSKYMPEDSIAVLDSRKWNYSKTSMEWLFYQNKTKGIEIRHALSKCGEHKIGKYHIDGYCEKERTCLEFNGCFYHGCPECYPHSFNPRMIKKYRNTQNKIKFLKKRNYKVMEMWGCEWSEMKKQKDVQDIIEDISDEYVSKINPRDALFGGRTFVKRPYYKFKRVQCTINPSQLIKGALSIGEEIEFEVNGFHYFGDIVGKHKDKWIVSCMERGLFSDVSSMYPSVMFFEEYPIGHPEIIKEDFKDISQYFGLVKCKVRPPSNLVDAILPEKKHGKLIFDLRPKTGTWTTVEVNLAVKHGYIIEKIYEVWNYKERSNTLFRDYMKEYVKMKVEASGWKKGMTEADKRRLIKKYKDVYDIEIDYDNVKYNAGMRAMSKLILNNLWGRFAMRPHYDKFKKVESLAEFYSIVLSGRNESVVAHIVDEETDNVEVSYKIKEDFNSGRNDTKTNVVLGAFVCAYARRKMYNQMSKLGRQTLYGDTDSICYISSPNGYEIPLGETLGEWTDELDGRYIVNDFVSLAPKTYSFEMNDHSFKIRTKGFSLDHDASKIIDKNSMKTLLQPTLDRFNTDEKIHEEVGQEVDEWLSELPNYQVPYQTELKVKYPQHMVRDKLEKRIFVRELEKRLKFTYMDSGEKSKGKVVSDHAGGLIIYPFGYDGVK